MARSKEIRDLKRWDELRENIKRSTGVPKESAADKAKRIKSLEADHEKWFEYYFPNYYTAKPNKFHREASKRFIENKRWYEVRAWSRELAKSTRARMETIFLALTQQIHYVLVVSNSRDNAERLITPFKIIFESNKRIISDYGKQVQLGKWESTEFTTISGVTFRALGAGESPRGALNENWRVDTILIDDFDTDEECRNMEVIDKKWDWIERALLPTLSVSGSYRVLFCGNVIAKDCCVTRAMKMANHVDIINIRDKNGKSSWPEKNTEEMIDQFLSMYSPAAQQQEFFNNPIRQGKIFKDMAWGKVPPLTKLKWVVVYGDPSQSNKDHKSNSHKSVFLIGNFEGKFYVYYGFLDHATNEKFVEWFYMIEEFIDGKTQAYNMIENNSLQDPFFEQVITPLFMQAGKSKGHYLPITPDTRKKPEKFARIEGNLLPLHLRGQLIFNEDQRSNPHMQRLEDQFKTLDPQLNAPADGPDCIEGGVFVLNQKAVASGDVHVTNRNPKSNSKRY